MFINAPNRQFKAPSVNNVWSNWTSLLLFAICFALVAVQRYDGKKLNPQCKYIPYAIAMSSMRLMRVHSEFCAVQYVQCVKYYVQCTMCKCVFQNSCYSWVQRVCVLIEQFAVTLCFQYNRGCFVNWPPRRLHCSSFQFDTHTALTLLFQLLRISIW